MTPSRTLKATRFLAAGLVLWACLGMSCEQNQDPPVLPSPTLTDIHLALSDPARGTAGVYLAWEYTGSQASYYEVYQSLARDSLLSGKLAPPARAESTHTLLLLPDLTRPFTVYYAVRAIWVEPTGQTQVSDSLRVDSLTATPALSILAPASASYLEGRLLHLQVQTQSDPGVALRMAYYEKTGDEWTEKADTCMPMDACGRPVFGRSVQEENLVLDQPVPGDTIPALFCVIGTESFQGMHTGLAQSLGCVNFFRVQP